MTKIEELNKILADVNSKIFEQLAYHSDEVAWQKVNELERMRDDLIGELNRAKNEAEAVEPEVEPDYVNHPPHYERDGAMECIDEMIMIFGKEEVMTFCKLCTWKYRYRSADKNGAQDIAKSDWYMRKYKELSGNTATISASKGNTISGGIAYNAIPCSKG